MAVAFAPAPAAKADSSSALSAEGLFNDNATAQMGLANLDEALSVTASFALGPQQSGSASAARRGEIHVTADIAAGWHIYSLTQPPGGPIATTITVEPSEQHAYELGGGFTTDAVSEKQTADVFGGIVVETHHGKLTWRAPLTIAAGVDPSKLTIHGSLRAQPCTESSCLPPKSYPFVARFSPEVISATPRSGEPSRAAEHGAPSTSDVAPTAGRAAAVQRPQGSQQDLAAAATAFSPGELTVEANEKIANTAVVLIMLMAFAGGFILNLMPCVLPVVGLKLLSFVQQSGQSRGRSFMLNLWYSLGLMSVFMVLATLAVALGLGWGMLFQYSGFTITLTAVVFAMALSFFDVWEIPIPGFAGRGKASQLGQREGVGGAFAKGVLTTFLATPCSAPLLAPALTWSATRSPLEVYMVFFFVGLGMAFPYLVIGTFPRLIRFLPKPGEWMDTFKHVMGFVLLATVVYLLTTLQPAHVVPTVALMFGLWAACWWVGRIPPTADRPAKLRGWLQAVIFTCIIVVIAYPGIDEVVPRRVSFGGLYDVMHHRLERLVKKRLAAAGAAEERKTSEDEIVWIPFSRKRLNARLEQGESVLVDFTADWCLTCKTLEAAVLDTPAVRKALVANNIVTMQADCTNPDAAITAMLHSLGSKQVPVIAVFPADRPRRPIVLRGGYTAGGLIEAIEAAANPLQADNPQTLAR